MRKIAVFTTSEIFTFASCIFRHPHGCAVVGEVEERGKTIQLVSYGALEKAMADCYEVFVCTTREKFGPHDEWWRKLVGDENIFMVKPRPEPDDPYWDQFAWGHLSVHDKERHFRITQPWVDLYAKLGFEYPIEGVGEEFWPMWWPSARTHLEENHPEVRLGYTLRDEDL